MARRKDHTRRPVPRTPQPGTHSGCQVNMGYGPSFDDGHPQESSDATSATSKNSSSAAFQSPSLDAKGGGTPLSSLLSAEKTPLIRDAGGNRELVPPAASADDTKKAETKSANTGHPGPASSLPSPRDPSANAVIWQFPLGGPSGP